MRVRSAPMVTFVDICRLVHVDKSAGNRLNQTAVRDIVCRIKIPLLPVGPPARRGDPAMDEKNMSEELPQSTSRRNFIKGVVAAGAVASSSAYLFRGATGHGQPAAGAAPRLSTLNVNGQDRR